MKTCPCCKALTFDDMETCYGCLYEYKQHDCSSSFAQMLLDDPEDEREKNDSWFIVIQEEGQPLRQESLPEGRPVYIGRSRANDIVLESLRVSRNHAKLSIHKGEVCLEDLNSKNGTECKGNKIQTKTIVHEGAVFSLGPVEITLKRGSLPSSQRERR